MTLILLTLNFLYFGLVWRCWALLLHLLHTQKRQPHLRFQIKLGEILVDKVKGDGVENVPDCMALNVMVLSTSCAACNRS